MEKAHVKKTLDLSPIWILPLIAFCIGSWLLYVSFRDEGVEITIHFENAAGISAGKTQIIYKGIPAGVVNDVYVNDDLLGVTITAEIAKSARNSLVEDSKFWIVRPQVAAGKVSGLDTILTGSYISVQPGKSKKFANKFVGLGEPPPLPINAPGLRITLLADKLYSLQKGSNVYTKDIKVGQVENFKLERDDKVAIDVHIQPEFAYLVKADTKFWNSSGISLGGDIRSGLQLEVESLAAMIYGGISFGTPHSRGDSAPAENGSVYQLYRNHDAADFSISMTLQLASGAGIVEGKTRVMYRGLKAGVVKHIRINSDANHTVTAVVHLDPRAEIILRENTRFWVVRPKVSIEGVKYLDTLVTGPYITFETGDGQFRNHFVVDQGDMIDKTLKAGTFYRLVSEDTGTIQAGSPVLYKKMPVGEITSISFSEDSKSVLFDFIIYEKYGHLLRKNSVFWNESGVSVDASLSKLEFQLASLKSLVSGGVSFLSPDYVSQASDAIPPEKSKFTLFKSYNEAFKKIPSLRPPGISLTLRAEKMKSLRVGSPVLYKNMRAGEVTDFIYDRKSEDVVVQVYIQEPYSRLVNASSRFYSLAGVSLNVDLSGVTLQSRSFESIVAGGVTFFTPDKKGKGVTRKELVLYENLQAAMLVDTHLLTLRFSEKTKIKNKTKIKYQGIDIGFLENIRFGPELKEIICDGIIRNDAVKLFRETSRIHFVGPSISLSGIENAETAVLGGYLDVSPGKGPARNEFIVSTKKTELLTTALPLVLEAERLGSLQVGSPLYYRQVKIGEVTGFELAPNAQVVWIHVAIAAYYRPLIRSGTVFWNVSGIRFSGGLLSEFKIVSESVEALVAGGIAMATPDEDQVGASAAPGDHYFLHEKSDPDWLNWSPFIQLEESVSK